MTQAVETRANGLLKDIWTEVNDLYDTIDPIGQKFLYEIPVRSGERQQTPMVLLLGNHSAGKSTFINHLLGKEVQVTGVAPTDDVFTLCMSGHIDETRDGQALLGTPEYGFGDLSRFGPGLINHVRMKTVTDAPILDNLYLVDSPGMIDSHESARRAYDFEGVVQWLAERADVVLLLFDPEKPGTTGETLRILTTSLRGLEHKMLIVLNKVDMFDSVHDFARAYGTLCWNLAKVVTTKDLPLIFNSYIPVPSQQHDGHIDLAPFDKAREKVIQEIKRAPERRIDNTVTKLYSHARQLQMHADICAEVASTVNKEMRWWWPWALGSFTVCMLAAYILQLNGYTWPYYGGAVLLGIALGVGCLKAGEMSASWMERDSIDDLSSIFERHYRRELEIADKGELREQWGMLKGRTRKALQTLGVKQVPWMWPGERQQLDEIIGKTVPKLRSKIHSRLLTS